MRYLYKQELENNSGTQRNSFKVPEMVKIFEPISNIRRTSNKLCISLKITKK